MSFVAPHKVDIEALASICGLEYCGAAYNEFYGVELDSRNCREGYIFAALEGARGHGMDYMDAAVQQGAVALLLAGKDYAAAQHLSERYPSLGFFVHDDPRVVLGDIAALFYPHKPRFITAVTGTNGKSSVVHFFRQICDQSGVIAASIGTLGVQYKGDAALQHDSLTTPNVIDMHRILATLYERGVTHVAIEASSHGIAQKRLAGLEFCAAAWTNFTPDHEDYHGGRDAYMRAKMSLFDYLQDGGKAFIWRGLQVPEEVYVALQHKPAQIYAAPQHITCKGAKYEFTIEDMHINLRAIGEFQLDNAVCAALLANACGVQPRAPLHLTPADGRMEVIYHGTAKNAATQYQPVTIIRDYAHTPDALQNSLVAAQQYSAQHGNGRVAILFGCGGERDHSKRPVMGNIAAQYANIIYITDDNPRSEDAAQIRAEIERGVQKPSSQPHNIAGRERAIKQAINALEPGDILLLAGKGHETYQITSHGKEHMDEREIVRKEMENGGE